MASYEDLESIHCSEIGYTGGRPGFPRHSLDGVIIRPRCMGNVKRGNGIRSRMVFTVPSGPCSRCSCCSGRATCCCRVVCNLVPCQQSLPNWFLVQANVGYSGPCQQRLPMATAASVDCSQRSTATTATDRLPTPWHCWRLHN